MTTARRPFSPRTQGRPPRGQGLSQSSLQDLAHRNPLERPRTPNCAEFRALVAPRGVLRRQKRAERSAPRTRYPYRLLTPTSSCNNTHPQRRSWLRGLGVDAASTREGSLARDQHPRELIWPASGRQGKGRRTWSTPGTPRCSDTGHRAVHVTNRWCGLPTGRSPSKSRVPEVFSCATTTPIEDLALAGETAKLPLSVVAWASSAWCRLPIGTTENQTGHTATRSSSCRCSSRVSRQAAVSAAPRLRQSARTCLLAVARATTTMGPRSSRTAEFVCFGQPRRARSAGSTSPAGLSQRLTTGPLACPRLAEDQQRQPGGNAVHVTTPDDSWCGSANGSRQDACRPLNRRDLGKDRLLYNPKD
jgi:hypothetical protein